MRVTLNDGRQMTGQMLAFDKVRPKVFNTRKISDKMTAYESCPGRHRGIPSRQAQTHERRTISTWKRSTCPGRVRREAHSWSYNRSRHAHNLMFGRWSSTSRSICKIRNERTRWGWRGTANTNCWTWYKSTYRSGSTYRIEWTCRWSRRTSTTWRL